MRKGLLGFFHHCVIEDFKVKQDPTAVVREDQNHGFAESISALHVVEIDPEADPRWEALVTMLPNGLVYHHPAWLLAFLLQAVVERVREEPRACLQLKLFSNPLDG